jgi:alanine-synthesizing transaminase
LNLTPRLDAKKFNLTDDMKLAFDLLDREHVLVVQGTGFNWPRPNHFRVVYLPDADTLKDALQRMGHFLSTYRQEDAGPIWNRED